MLGLVFTEFAEMVESAFGPDCLDDVYEAADIRHDGAYTAVGNYDHAELVAMVVALSQQTGVPVPELVRTFGRHLMDVFVAGYAHFFEPHAGLFDFLHSVDGIVHREVVKLYEHARPPQLVAETVDADTLRLVYASDRGMGDLAVGLIEGAAAHYGEQIEITRQTTDAGETFTLSRKHAA